MRRKHQAFRMITHQRRVPFLDFRAQQSCTAGRASFKLTHELNSVVNYGDGVDIQTGEKSIISFGFVTDFSAHVPGTSTNLSSSTGDVYYLSSRTSLTVGTSEVTVGWSILLGVNKSNNSSAFQVSV